MALRIARQRVSTNQLLLAVALAFTVFYNRAFFGNVVQAFPLQSDNILFLFSLAALVFLLSVFVLGLFCTRYTTRVLMYVLFPCAALASYFMDSYNVIIDSTMLQNVIKTDTREVGSLFSPVLLVYLLVLGVLPIVAIHYLEIHYKPFWKEVRSRMLLLASSLGLIVVVLLMSSNHFATFFREEKILRYYTNPLTWMYSSGAYLSDQLAVNKVHAKTPIGLDAQIPASDTTRELVIVVLGETARGDRFSLNGYERETNPMLDDYKVVSFHDVQSCATTTAISLPCMFSARDSSDFDIDNARAEENLLDVLDHAGVNVVWLDNNSDSKGVAKPEIFRDMRSPDVNPVCDTECRDLGMLSGLDDYIAAHDSGDIVIVMHQMGNHGPAYFERYPDAFEKFTPACESNQLQDCTQEEINNAYDNAILYTDFFLANVIDYLKGYDEEFETAMLYMSDHGESLGEHSLYLHGLPFMLAPKEQKQVAKIIWLGKNYHMSVDELVGKEDMPLSHDNFFHTVLGMLEIQTEVYKPELDVLHSPNCAACAD